MSVIDEIFVPLGLPSLPPYHRRGLLTVKLDVEQLKWMQQQSRRAAFERAIEILIGIIGSVNYNFDYHEHLAMQIKKSHRRGDE